MKKIKIILVTHGETEEGFNAPLSDKGIEQMKELLRILELVLPWFIDKVYIGTGDRHAKMIDILRQILMLKVQCFKSEHAGSKASQSKDKKHVYTSEAEKVPIENLKGEIEKAIANTKAFLFEISNSVVLGSRLVAIAAGISQRQAKSACIYKIEIFDGKISIKEIFSVD